MLMGESTDKRTYRVLINGENFHLTTSGDRRKMGFFTTRYVEAVDPEEAERLALELIKSDPNLLGIMMYGGDDTPALCAEEIEEVSDGAFEPSAGYAFYSEGE
jgi:hypothetical protein